MSEAVLEGPALAPPAGVIPDLVNPPNRNIMAYVVMGILLIITFIIVPLRLWTRFFVMKERRFLGDCKLPPIIPARVTLSCIRDSYDKAHSFYRC